MTLKAGLVSLFAMDAVAANVIGETANGRDAIEEFHELLLRSSFKDGTCLLRTYRFAW